MSNNTLSHETHNEILDVTDPYAFDESIYSMKFVEYFPMSQLNNNRTSTKIAIDVHAADTYVLPSESYISIKLKLTRADNNEFDAAHEISLINNAVMYLFDNIEYELGGKQIESINNPGQVTSMLGYLKYPDDFSTSAGLSCCWSKDTTNNANSAKYSPSGAIAANDRITPAENPNYNQGFAARKAFLNSSDPRGMATFHIPFSHIFGSAEYKKVIYGLKHSLYLNRSNDTQALFRAAGVANGKINVVEIVWIMPTIELSPVYLAGMRDIIDKKQILPYCFSARKCYSSALHQTNVLNWTLSGEGGVEKPRWIIVGFQTDKINSQEQNPAVFDHLNFKNAYVTLNGVRYPDSDIKTNFRENDYMKLYCMFDNFKKEYYGIDSLVGGTQVNVSAYKTLFPIIVFDVRKQSEKMKNGVSDITMKFEFGDNVPANTMGYAIVISDRIYKISSDGKNMSVVCV